MTDRTPSKPTIWRDLDIPALEADVAYFEARLSLVGTQQDSLYQRAQQRTYYALEEAINSTLTTLRKGMKKR